MASAARLSTRKCNARWLRLSSSLCNVDITHSCIHPGVSTFKVTNSRPTGELLQTHKPALRCNNNFGDFKKAVAGQNSQPYRSASTSLFRRPKEFDKPWHDPSFMEVCSPETVEQWLVSLLKYNKEKESQCLLVKKDKQVDSIAYLRVLEAYAKSKIGGAPQKAEYWIGQLERHYSETVKTHLEHTEQVKINQQSSSDISITTRVTDDTGAEPKSSFAKFITSRSQAYNTDMPENKQKHVNKIQEVETPKHLDIYKDAAAAIALQPTVECYNAVIEAWSNDNDKVSVVRARRWLSKLEGLDTDSSRFPEGHPLRINLKPNARSYDLYLHSCSRGIGRKPKLHRQRAEDAEKMLRYRLSNDTPLSIRPTTESYNYCIRAWTRCRKEFCVADKVMSLVREMESIQRDYVLGVNNRASDQDLWKEHVSPNTKTYTMAIDAWIVVATLKANMWYSEQLELDNTYKVMMRTRSNGVMEDRGKFLERRNKFENGDNEMEKAASILHYIQSLEAAGRADINATVIGYNTLLSGWARLSNSMRSEIPFKSESILREMMESAEKGNKNAAPDVMSFNAVIKAWANTRRPNSASRSEWWLRRMIRESNNAFNEDDVSIPSPNTHTYNIVMESYLQLGDPGKVQDLIVEMDASDFVSPNSESFSKIIRAWLQDEIKDQQKQGVSGLSCEHAYKWLKELLNREKSGVYRDLGPAPDLFASILKTAAKTHSRGENILAVGQGTFWAMRESRFGVNNLAFEWLLEIGLKVLASVDNRARREDFVNSLLEQCCKDGYLSGKFISMIRSLEMDERSAADEGKDEILNKYLQRPPFPATWTRNISVN